MADPDLDAYRAAERLVREAQERAEAAAAAADVPPGGWEAPGASRATAFPDVSSVLALVELARGALPPELSRQLADALRDLLLALRAVIDYSVARLERPDPAGPEVQDIPVE